jgi:hypothetical protein
LGKACHIHAAAKGGPRFNQHQTPEQRANAANGIWLCSMHADEVDVDDARFPAELLKQWKTEAERAADLALQSQPAASAAEVLLAAASDLLSHPQKLPDGTWLNRPEIERIRELLTAEDSPLIALLGVPGSGKSAFLARLGGELRSEGWSVVAIKADRLPSSVASASDLERHLGLAVPVSRVVYALSRNAKTILLLDQLDALSDLADAKTERLAVLLSLVASVRVAGIPVVCSVREFDFQHDMRFSSLEAEQVHLAPIAAPELDAVLGKRGLDVTRIGPKLRSLLAVPYWLKQFVQLTWRSDSPLPDTSQALLEVVWQQTVLQAPAHAVENDEVATQLADVISEREELWIPRAELAPVEPALRRLLALGILATDGARLRVSFAHQTLYEFARARAFVSKTSLSAYVADKQGSLFVRPTIWAALQYLRVAAPDRYRQELASLWNGGPRAHLRSLLLEFLGQVDPPEDFEIALLQPLFLDERWSRAAFNAAARSSGWIRYIRRGLLPRALQGKHPDTTYGAIVASLKLARDESLSLMGRHWSGGGEYARRGHAEAP